MKKNIFILVILTVALVGCKDNAEVRSAIGTYSYKSSGTLVLDSLNQGTSDTLIQVAFTEIGALEVISMKDKDSVMVTFNELLGDVYSTRGSIKGNEIILQPFFRRFVNGKIIYPTTIAVTGNGHIYDSSIVMNLNYSGLAEDSLALAANDVQLIAKKNK